MCSQHHYDDTGKLIFDTVGVTPAFFRPPFIATSPDMYANIDLPFINGINCTDWDSSVTSEQRVETILKNVKDGDIILLHDFDGNINTVNALDQIIQGLVDDGYALVTISKLFELKGVEPDVENKIWTNTNW
jgi:peptidoglycan/xylan/chitin deacetylase (PgdA/CDA1 family)